MEAELEAYEYQLSQVKLSLQADPGNVELTTLKGELEEIIDLTKQALGVSGTKAAGVAEGSSKGKGKSKEKGFKAGDEVSARYKDMKWYPARITAISGPSDNLSYTLIFKGYTTPITLPAVCLKPISEQPAESLELAPPSTLGGVKRKLSAAEEEKEREKRKKKNDKWAEKQKEKTQETLQKKSAWESFGKKAAKKGHKIGGLEGKSIFRTPDNPTVGVVGSGQGVTSYDKMGKHKFNAAGQRED